MVIIQHRCNTREQLEKVPSYLGVEVDIRSHGTKLVIHHDPFEIGESFERWLEAYDQQHLILNVKEEGLESRLIALMERYEIKNFFFLDQTFPFLVKMAEIGEKRCAIRVSEFESIETPLKLAGKVDWIWVDYFSRFPLTVSDERRLFDAGFKLCLVSPELQGYSNPSITNKLREQLQEMEIKVSAVCTKFPSLWAQD